MTSTPEWLPDLIFLDDYGGNWKEYEDAIYEVFKRDFLDTSPVFRGVEVKFRRHPMLKGKVATFWHITSEGKNEDERTPDLRRCERIGWARAVIENCNDERIKVWENHNRGERRICLWLEEQDYLLILGIRGENYVLWTAYCIAFEWRRRQIRREYEDYHSKNG